MQHPNSAGPNGSGVTTGELAGDMSPERQMAHQASGGGPGFFARETSGCGPLTATEGTRCSRPGTLLKQHIGVSPSGSCRPWRGAPPLTGADGRKLELELEDELEMEVLSDDATHDENSIISSTIQSTDVIPETCLPQKGKGKKQNKQISNILTPEVLRKSTRKVNKANKNKANGNNKGRVKKK